MTVTNTPAFGQTPRKLNAVLTAAKTSLNDTANAVSLGATGANGSLLVKIGAFPRASVSTAIQLQLYLNDGTNTYLIGSTVMGTYSMVTSTAIPATTFLDVNSNQITDQNPMYLPATSGTTYTLYAGAGAALSGGIVVTAELIDL